MAASNHIYHWIVSGSGWRDFGFVMPVGVVTVTQAVNHASVDSWLQTITFGLGVISLLVTIFIKLWKFIKKTQE